LKLEYYKLAFEMPFDRYGSSRLPALQVSFTHFFEEESDDDALLVSYSMVRENIAGANPDHDRDLQAMLRESFEEAPSSYDEEVIMGVSVASTPPKLTYVDHDSECCLCWDI
jgi:hypothetical protein